VSFSQHYHQKINQGNRYLFKCDYLNAEIHYEQASVNKAMYFFQDLKKLIYVKTMLDKRQEALNYIQILISEKGLHHGKILDQFPYLKFTQDERNKIKQLYIIASEAKTLDPDVEFIREIYKIDQGLRFDEMADIKYNDSVTKDNAKKLLAFLEVKPWPNENRAGVFFKSNQEWTGIAFTLGLNMVKKEPELLKYFYREALEGNIHPSYYASISDVHFINTRQKDSTLNYMNTTIELVLGVPYTKLVHYSDSLMAYVNHNRIAIGLDSFHIVQEQVAVTNYLRCSTLPELKIGISAYSHTASIPAGWVNFAFEKECADLNKWKIDMTKFKKSCWCRKEN
jgi:hypothetical protein